VEDRDYSAFLAEVRGGTDLVSLVSEFVSLRRAGRRHKGLCPFHDEKTPSFTVDGERGLFYCFGCNTGGDAFKFLMLREGLEFADAARRLGERLGLKPPERKGPGSDQRRRILAANAAALSFYRGVLADEAAGRAARDYLARRGVRPETCDRFEIGFAPAAWDRLHHHLTGLGYSDRILIDAGLLSDRDADGRRVYDRFRNRIVFPIRSLGGEVIAFGGRTLDPAEPAKYLNSPETPVYVKGEVLYGLGMARDAIRERNAAVLVEGYLDLIGLSAAGFPNVVATLGTALTTSQAQLLRRTTDRIQICYDPDAAGRAATLRALEILLGTDVKVQVVSLPDGVDPDDFVRQQGAEAFGAALAAAEPAIAFLAGHFASGLDLKDPKARAAGINRLLPYLARVPSVVERAGYLSTIAERFRVEEDLILAELGKALKQGRRDLPAAAARPAGRPAPVLNPAEARLLGILITNPVARLAVLDSIDVEDLGGSRLQPIVAALEGVGDAAIDAAAFLELLPDDESRALAARALMQQDGEGTPEDAAECLRTLHRARLTRERDKIQRELERSADTAALNDLMSRKMELSRRIDALS